jgi:hypothetical protein
VTWGVLAAATAIFGVVVTVSAFATSSVAIGLLVFALFLVPSLLIGRYAVGCAKAGLLVTDQKIVIRNPLRQREVPVADVLRFSAGAQPASYGNPTPGVVLELKDGLPIRSGRWRARGSSGTRAEMSRRGTRYRRS